jgi:high-affinity iron transporter
MLPTFVIGLREGLEAALIVGIIAAFLRKQGRRDLLRWVFVGAGVAVLFCVAAGVALNVLSKDLPQRQQEGLETIIGALAVGMVTYMVIWMKRHSRDLKGQLEGLAKDAMGGTSGAARAMILMAFLAVLREGIETVVFLLAAFDQSTSGSSAAFGASLGIVTAVVLGYGIYRGGVRINLSKFFRATGLVLVFVAAGILVNTLHTAHEAGWLNVGQGSTLDLTRLVRPGSVQSSLLTGMLGLQSHPVVIEVVGWLVYLIPVGIYVAWPPGKGLAHRTTSRILLGTGAALVITGAVLALVQPSAPATYPSTSGNRVVSMSASSAVIATGARQIGLRHDGEVLRGGTEYAVYRASRNVSVADLPARVPYARVARLNGGHLPLGLTATATGSAQLRYAGSARTTAWIEPRTHRIVSLTDTETITATVTEPDRGTFVLSPPIRSDRTTLVSADNARTATAAAAADGNTLDQRRAYTAGAWTAGALGFVALLAGLGLALPIRRRVAVTDDTPAPDLVTS